MVKVKCTLVQALRLCTGRTAHRGSRGILYSFTTNGTKRGWGVRVTPRPLFTTGKDPVPIVQEAGWAPGPVSTGAEKSACVCVCVCVCLCVCVYIYIYIYIYIIFSHKLWYMLLGTEFVFFIPYRLSTGGASRSIYNCSVSPYDHGYLLYVQCTFL